VRGLTNTFCPLTSKPATSAETQEKDIFISLKNTDKTSTFVLALPTTLTDKLNELLTAYYKNPSNGSLDIAAPIHSTSWLANGNIILTFKTRDGAQQARVHSDGWVKFIDPSATTPQCTFTVVAHNVPTAIWNDPATLREAMTEIEMSNTEVALINFTIANMTWLNGQDARNKTGRGPLIHSFKSKNAANMDIDSNLAICRVTSSVSIYIPRLLQCF